MSRKNLFAPVRDKTGRWIEDVNNRNIADEKSWCLETYVDGTGRSSQSPASSRARRALLMHSRAKRMEFSTFCWPYSSVLVQVGAEELLAEVVVRIVPLDGVHAAGGAAQAGSDILALDVQYLVLGELVDYGDVLSALNGVGVGVGRAAGHPGLEGDLRAGGMWKFRMR